MNGTQGFPDDAWEAVPILQDGGKARGPWEERALGLGLLRVVE